MNESILITGAAGFIGFHLAKKVLDGNENIKVIGYDNLSDYYDVNLKIARLDILLAYKNFTFIKADLADKNSVDAVFEKYIPNIVVHLAAQAGVRYSITNPEVYLNSNIVGFFNILEACRKHSPQHLVYASSSSVYGNNKKTPFSTSDMTDSPVSLYAATKKSNELIAYSYASMYGLKMTGLRFFTVYGPYGRPDMAMFLFTDKMVKNKSISLFNKGDMWRDFTYIDDIVEGTAQIMNTPPASFDNICHKIYNIGNSSPEKLVDFTSTLERVLLEEKMISAPAKIEYLPMQPGDVYKTYADTTDLEMDFSFKPYTKLEDGIRSFAKWYKNFYLKG